MIKITITRALNELKLLDKRIEKETSTSSFVATIQKDKKINGRLSIEEFSKIAKTSLESIEALISRRSLIKQAIVMSNANTVVTVGEETMTVAQAIERKSSVKYESQLLNVIESQLKYAEAQVSRGNEEADKKALDGLTTTLGKEGNKNPKKEDFQEIYNPIYERYEWKLIDPIVAQPKIISLRKRIEDFESNVDCELSTSNSTTYIEV